MPALELCIPTAISRQLNPMCMGRDFCSGPRWLQMFFPIRVLHCHVLLWGQVLHLGCGELICRETGCEIPTFVEGITSHAAGFGCKESVLLVVLVTCVPVGAQVAWQHCAKGLCFVPAIQQRGTGC